MKNYQLSDFIEQAQINQQAIGHFNISNLEGLQAIVRAALAEKAPVIIGLSQKELNYFGAEQVSALVQSYREEFNHPLFLNADHAHSLELIEKVAKLGFDSITADSSQTNLSENIIFTKEAVSLAKKENPLTLIEGEIGYIGASSKLLDEIPQDIDLSETGLTTVEDAFEFANSTKIDLFAPAVGNIHGRLKNVDNPRLNLQRINDIHKVIKLPLVLHGGSGIVDEDFVGAIEAGIRIIHINTEIRVVFRQTLEKTLANQPEEIAPYNLFDPAIEEMTKIIAKRIRLFSNNKEWGL